MKLRKRTIFSIVLGVLITAFVLFGSEAIPQYDTTGLKKNTVMTVVDFTSTWYPTGYAKISLGAKSDIKKVNVKEGQYVSKGQVVAELVNVQEYNQYKTAWASYNAAVYNMRSVEDNPLATDNQVKAAQQQVNSAYYQMKNAEYAMNKKKLKAPISGTVVTISKRDYESSGASAASLYSSAASLTTSASSSSGNYIVIVNGRNPTFTAQVTEREVVQIEKGDVVTVTSKLNEKKLKAKVTYIGKAPIVEGEDPRYEILVKLDEFPKGYPYGIKLEGSIVTEKLENVDSVPYESVTIDSETEGSLIVLENGELVSRKVEIGLVGDDSVEVLGGLSESDEIVIDQLEDKKVIRIRPWLRNLFKKN